MSLANVPSTTNEDDEMEVWTIKKMRITSEMYGIVSNKSDWYIAEEMLKKHAELMVELFNKSNG